MDFTKQGGARPGTDKSSIKVLNKNNQPLILQLLDKGRPVCFKGIFYYYPEREGKYVGSIVDIQNRHGNI